MPVRLLIYHCFQLSNYVRHGYQMLFILHHAVNDFFFFIDLIGFISLWAEKNCDLQVADSIAIHTASLPVE